MFARTIVRARALASLVLTLVLVLAGASAAWAGAPSDPADPLRDRTELGITITKNDIFNAFQESTEFWPPLRKLLCSDDFAVAHLDQRKEAAAFVKKVQDQLHAQLFSDDEAQAADLIEYVAWGLRRIAFYRELDAIVGDHEAMVALHAAWQRDYHQQARSGQGMDVPRLVSEMNVRMRKLNLPAEKQERVQQLWSNIGYCMVQIDATRTGQLILKADQEASQMESGELVRHVAAAADWATIIKDQRRNVSRADFLQAWQELELHRVPQVADSR